MKRTLLLSFFSVNDSTFQVNNELLHEAYLLLRFLRLNNFTFQVNNELVDEAYAVAKIP
jgi:hypothetical protein